MPMRQIILPILFLLSFEVSSQETKDTVFTVRGFYCSCKYNIDASGDNQIFSRNQEPSYYPGGEENWRRFLKKNLSDDFKGRDELQVRFLVDKNGDLSEFVLLNFNNKIPKEKFDEVVRVLKLSGKWFPSKQGGYCVKSYVRLMVPL